MQPLRSFGTLIRCNWRRERHPTEPGLPKSGPVPVVLTDQFTEFKNPAEQLVPLRYQPFNLRPCVPANIHIDRVLPYGHLLSIIDHKQIDIGTVIRTANG